MATIFIGDLSEHSLWERWLKVVENIRVIYSPLDGVLFLFSVTLTFQIVIFASIETANSCYTKIQDARAASVSDRFE